MKYSGVVFSSELQQSIEALGTKVTLKEISEVIRRAKKRPCELRIARVVGDKVKWLQARKNARYVVEIAPSRGGRSTKCITWTADETAASSQVIDASRMPGPVPVTTTEANLQNLGVCSTAVTSMYEIVMAKQKIRKRKGGAGYNH